MMVFSWETLITVIAAIVIIGGILGRGWLKIQNDTMLLIKNQNVELKTNYDCLLINYNKLQIDLVTMRAEIDTIKNIPLIGINQAMKDLSSTIIHLLDVNNKILHRLTLDAHALSKDTTIVANARKQVKSDLKEHDNLQKVERV